MVIYIYIFIFCFYMVLVSLALLLILYATLTAVRVTFIKEVTSYTKVQSYMFSFFNLYLLCLLKGTSILSDFQCILA